MKPVRHVVFVCALAGAAGGCSGSSTPPPAPAATPAPAPAAEALSNNTISTPISNPDEAMNALATLAQPADWKKHVDASTAVAASDKLKVAAAIGMQSANGMAAQYAGDDATAEKLATSIKGLADRLSLKSSGIEALVAKTAADFKEPDAAKRSALVRGDILRMQDELKGAFDRLGDGAAATLMVFGGWVEGVRMTSALLQAKYDATNSDVLNRRAEADYFLAQFAGMPSDSDPIYAQLTPALTRLRDAMTANASRQIPQPAVATIHSAAAELAGVLRK